MTHYRVDHMIYKAKNLLVKATDLSTSGVVATEEIIKAVAACVGAIEALAIATDNMDLRYDQLNGKVHK